MDYELISYALGLAIFGGFLWLLSHVSFKQGLELGKRMAVAPVSRPSRAVVAQPVPPEYKSYAEFTVCAECKQREGHAPDCRANKPKPDRRRWMGFSRIKAELENKESA